MPYPAPSNIVFHNDSKTITFDVLAYDGGAGYPPDPSTTGQTVYPRYSIDGTCGGPSGECGGSNIEPSSAVLGSINGSVTSFTIQNVVINATYRIWYEDSSSNQSSQGSVVTDIDYVPDPDEVATMDGMVAPTPGLPDLSLVNTCGEHCYLTIAAPQSDFIAGTGASAVRLGMRWVNGPTGGTPPGATGSQANWGFVNFSELSTMDIEVGAGTTTGYILDRYRIIEVIEGTPTEVVHYIANGRWYEFRWEYQDGSCAYWYGPTAFVQSPYADGNIEIFRKYRLPDGRWTITYRMVLNNGESPFDANWTTPSGAVRV